MLALEDGSVYQGSSVGAEGSTVGEVVFSTCMTGYQEMLTDPSYAGQLLTLTYPLIGNYGISESDFESSRVQAAGLVIRGLCDSPSNWRSTGRLDEFLRSNEVVGIQGVDTRAVARRLRVQGVMMGGISTVDTPAELLRRISDHPAYDSVDLVRRVSADQPYLWKDEAVEDRYRIALIDLGVKRNILRSLSALGCRIRAYPCDVTAAQILGEDPDGVVISPGPGDPALLDYALRTVSDLIGKKPLLGICLGHQLLGRALGARTFKLKFGHRGGNHPVKDLLTSRVYITSQNHGYAVDERTLPPGWEPWFFNANDGTNEGIRHQRQPFFSVQFHPEATPGSTDTTFLFDHFAEVLR